MVTALGPNPQQREFTSLLKSLSHMAHNITWRVKKNFIMETTYLGDLTAYLGDYQT